MWGLLCGSSFEAAQPFRRSPLHFGIRQVIEKSSEINGIILRRRFGFFSIRAVSRSKAVPLCFAAALRIKIFSSLLDQRPFNKL